MTIRLFPATKNRYAFVVQWGVIYTALTIARHQIGHVRFPFADSTLAVLPILWSLGALLVYQSRFTGAKGEPIAPLTTNRYAFILGSAVIYGLFWIAELQSKNGGLLVPSIVWMVFVMIEYPSRRTRGIRRAELFTGVVATAGIGLALGFTGIALLQHAGVGPRHDFLLSEPQWVAVVIVAYALFWGGAAMAYDWAERRWPLKRALYWAAYLANPRDPQAVEAQRLGLGLGLRRHR